MLKLFLHSVTGWYYTEHRGAVTFEAGNIKSSFYQEHDLLPSGDCEQQDGLVWSVKYIHFQD